MEWDYSQREVHISMPGYIKKALKKFRHKMPAKHKNSLYPHVPDKYGAKVQYAPTADQSTPLDKEGKKYIQKVCGKFLYLC